MDITGLAAKWRREADASRDEAEHYTLIDCADELEKAQARPGADYWIEVPRHLSGDLWYPEMLEKAGLEFLYVGPRGTTVAFLKVRDPGAPASLMHKTVRLTIRMNLQDPNASPPTCNYKISERKDMNP